MINRYHFNLFSDQKIINAGRKLFNAMVLLMLTIIISSASLSATNPPHPSLLKKIKEGKIDAPYFLANKESLMLRGVSMPWRAPSNNRSQVGPSLVPTGATNALAIIVDFSDNVNSVTATYFDDLLFDQVLGTLWDYFKDVSYGTLDIVTVDLPSSIGWINAPQTYAYYVNGQNGFGTYPQNAQKLVEDVVNAVDGLVDFSVYDNDGDNVVDALFIIHAGQGAEFTGNDNDIWSHAWTTFTPPFLDGVSIIQYSMEPEYWATPGDMTIGVYAHELGHALFGLPDLYDRDGSSAGLGSWSLMSGGSWNGTLGDTPSFPDAWSHVEMGYVTTTDIAANTANASIANVEDNAEVYRVWTNGAAGTQYFLVENRQPVSYDAALPGDGLLIYHIDEAVTTQNDKEWYPGFTALGHFQVALEQADGLFDLESPAGNFGDAADPYPGSTANSSFDLNSIPDSRDYNSNDTFVAVRNISASGNLMTADLYVTLGDPGIISVQPDSVGADLFTGETTTKVFTISNDVGGGHLLFDISISTHDTTPALSLSVIHSWEMQKIDMSGWSQSTVPAAGARLTPNPTALETYSSIAIVNGLAPKVLFLTADGDPINAETALVSTGLFSAEDIDFLDSPISITIDDLLPYDAVLVWSNAVFSNPTNIGDVLKEYVDSGGGVVISTYSFSLSWAMQGGILDPNYSPFLPVSSQSVSGQINLASLTRPNHPIFSGITVAPTYWWNSNYTNPTLNAGGILLASDTNGNRVVAENSAGSVVGITVFPGNLTDVLTNASTNLMFANALNYVSTRWLSASPLSGSVAPGSSADIEVTFDAFGLAGGEYKLDLVVASNDTAKPEERVLAHLNVTGAPDIAISEDTHDYGITYIGFPKSFDLVVSNEGVESLSVTDISTDNGLYTVDKTVFNVDPGNRDTVKVTLNPTTAGMSSATLSITSNDPDESLLTVGLLGESLIPPILGLTPDSLSQVLVTGDSAFQTFTIDNSGTREDLVWDISTFASATVFPQVTAGIIKAGLIGGDSESSPPMNTFANSIFDYAYMAEQISNSILVLNTITNEVVQTIPVGSFPHRLEFSPDGGEVWVANKNDEMTSVIRTSDNTVIANFHVGYGPFGMAFTPDGRYVYQAIRFDYKVVVIDAATKEIVATITLPGGGEGDNADPKDVAITSDGRYAYVVSQGGPVYVIDIATNTLENTIFGATGGHTIRISRDGLRAYFSEGSSNYPNTFRVLDLTTNTLSGTIGNFEGSEGFDITADGRFAYVMDRWANRLQKLDLVTNSVDKIFTDDSIYNGYGVALSTDGNYGYATVSWNPENYGIHIFDTETDVFISHIETDKRIREIITFDQSGVFWLSATPESGTLIPGSSVDIEVKFHAPGLRAGNYGAIIEVNNNDPGLPKAKIPVKFKVLPPPIDPPVITSITDVPDDQGGWVVVSWDASPDDDFFSSTPVQSYSIWLRNDFPEGTSFNENEVLIKPVNQPGRAETKEKVSSIAINKSNLLSSSSVDLSSNLLIKNLLIEPNQIAKIIRSPLIQKGEALPKRLSGVMSDHGRWIGIGTIDAIQDSAYSFLVHTLKDSNSSGMNYSVIRISAHPENPFTFVSSEPDSGHSVDNKNPSPPTDVTAGMGAEGLVLNWIPIEDEDFDFYAIYRSEEAGFDPSSQDYFGTTTDSFFVDSDIIVGSIYYYRLSSFDFNGNESDFTGEITSQLIGVDAEQFGIPTEYALAQNYPNPFNPVTSINYSLPNPGKVSLVIYDLNGRMVMRWDEVATQAGYFQKSWNGTNIAGNNVSSGVYLYRLISGEFVQTKKMLLLK